MPANDASSGGGEGREETVHLDCSRILEYVSRRELSRFEGAESRAESKAIAAAQRAEAEKAASKVLERNARESGTKRGRGRGSRMLSGLGLPQGVHTRGRPRGSGRPRGRPRGSGRARGRLAIQGENKMVDDLTSKDVTDLERLETTHLEEANLHAIIADTSEEESEGELPVGPASPNLARSSFIANSALSMSPIATHRRLAKPLYSRYEVSEVDELDAEEDNMSMSSAAAQLQVDGGVRGRPNLPSDESEKLRHRTKRQRTESTSTSRPPAPAPYSKQPSSPTRNPTKSLLAKPVSSSSEESSSSSGSNTVTLRQTPITQSTNSQLHRHAKPTYQVEPEGDVDEESDPDESDTEEYVIEAILDHSCIDDTKHYLVKWQGYENSSDWVSAEDLAGAPEMVAEYEEKVRRRRARERVAIH